ncbi:MAG: AAA family ATPase [Pirellulales bacterium]
MPQIAILNQKGGVGKTTTAVNLSAALADLGKRVLLIDLDPQAHATLHLGVVPGDDVPSVYDVLCRETPLKEIVRPIHDRLDLIPSSIDLAAAEVELAGEVGRELLLRDHLAPLAGDYDYVLVDCAPSLGVLTLNALAAVEEVVIPLQPHFLALHGLSKLLETIEIVARRINGKLTLGGVVFCMFEAGTRLANEVTRDVDDFFEHAKQRNTPWSQARPFKARIRRNIRLAEAPSFGQSIFKYAPDSHGAEDYRALARELAGATATASAPRARAA